MSDKTTAPGVETAMAGFTNASKSMQTFASEIARMSKESMDHTAQLVEKLRGAKTIEEVVSIQTSFMQQSFSNYADYTRRFGELVTMLPLEMAKQARTAMQKGTEAVAKSAEDAGHQVQHATEAFSQAQPQHNDYNQNNSNDYTHNNDYNHNNNNNNY